MSRATPHAAILYRDAWFLVLHKPSGMPTTSPGPELTLTAVAHELDPKAPRLHPSSRLDAEVSGVVVFARTRDATEHLLVARKQGAYQRGYLALARAAPQPLAGDFKGAIARSPHDPRKRVVTSNEARSAKAAHTRYRTLSEHPGGAALWLEPQTGRTHQLRVHAAHAGVPLLGDRHYGGATRIVLDDGSVLDVRRTMLHCARVCVPGREAAAALQFEAPIPEDLQALWQALAGTRLTLP